jgi:hypothetical protein
LTNFSINPKTTPIALVLIGGAIILMLIYAMAFGHMDHYWSFVFMLFAFSAICFGVGLEMRALSEGKAVS